MYSPLATWAWIMVLYFLSVTFLLTLIVLADVVSAQKKHAERQAELNAYLEERKEQDESI